MSSQKNTDLEDNNVLGEERQKPQPPRRYKVLLNNDDYTPMDFVVTVLAKFFNMDFEKANQIMLTVHYQGKAVCGIYTSEIAETKVMQVSEYARAHQHPLLCTMAQA